MTRELFGTMIIYGVTIVVTPLVLYQMGYEFIQWIKKWRAFRVKELKYWLKELKRPGVKVIEDA